MKLGFSVSLVLLGAVVVGSALAEESSPSAAATANKDGGGTTNTSLLRKKVQLERRVLLGEENHSHPPDSDDGANPAKKTCLRWLIDPSSSKSAGNNYEPLDPSSVVDEDYDKLVGNNRRLLSKQQSHTTGTTRHHHRRAKGEIPIPPAQTSSEDNDEDEPHETSFEEDSSNEDTPPMVSSKRAPWPHEKSEIPLDPAITYGELEENGFRYMIMPNKDPPGQLELLLHIDVGSISETDQQQGIAHYIEHMMFQTTRNFPKTNSIWETFQKLGLRFNAYTTFDETVYFLSLPNMEEEVMTASFNWMRDIMDGALLETEEIDNERGVIISELEQGEGVFRRQQLIQWKWMLPDARMNDRWPIGLEENILAFDKYDFENFYQTYYTPRMATFVVVGDIIDAVADMETLIKSTFATVEDVGPSPEQPDFGPATPGLGFRTNVFYDPEVREDELKMEVMTYVGEPTVDNELTRYDNMKRSIANLILSKRFREMATKDPKSPIQVFSYSGSSQLWPFRNPSITVTPKDGMWREAVAILEQEWRRAIQYGFTNFEFEQAKAQYLTTYEQQVISKDTRDSSTLIMRLNGAINPGSVVTTPEEQLRIAQAILDAITLEALQEAFVNDWNTTDINLYMNTNTMDHGTIEEVSQELKDLFVASSDAGVGPPQEKEAIEWAYTDFGPPGTVVADAVVEDLGFRQLTLSNNIRVNMMKTDFSAGMVSFTARFGNGQLSQPKDATYLDGFTRQVFNDGGLGEHQYLDIRDIFASSTARSSFGIQEGYFSFSGGSNQEDLEQALQLLTAQITDSAFREEAVALWRVDVPWKVNSIRFSERGGMSELFAWLIGNDKRFTNPTEEDLLSYEASDASDWIVPFLNNSYMEFSIVGDFEEETALDLILNTLGTLPEREDSPAEITDEDRFIESPEPQANTATYETQDPQAIAYVAWKAPTYLTEDIVTTRHFGVLSSIFSTQMFDKIREEFGAAYSVYAYQQGSDAFDYSFMSAVAYGKPEEVEVFTNIILEIADTLSTGGITEDMLERAIAPAVSSVEDRLRENRYWLSVIGTSQAEPYKLDWARSFNKEFYESITLDQLNALGMEYLLPDQAYPMAVFPVNVTDA